MIGNVSLKGLGRLLDTRRVKKVSQNVLLCEKKQKSAEICRKATVWLGRFCPLVMICWGFADAQSQAPASCFTTDFTIIFQTTMLARFCLFQFVCELFVVTFSAASLNAAPLDLSTAKVFVANPDARLAPKTTALLVTEIEQRTRVRLEVAAELPPANQPTIILGTAQALAQHSLLPPAGLTPPQKAEGFALWVDTKLRLSPTICVAGFDERGTLFGVGRLLRLLELGRDTIHLDSETKLATAPVIPLRGHQLGYRPKTNSYDGWTLPMWEQYLRDMIVFGMNAIELIPPHSDDAADSPHFPQPPLQTMIGMSQLAHDYGLELWIWYPALDKDYADPKTVASALAERKEIFQRLPKIDAVFVPGGDPGDTRPDLLLQFTEQTKTLLNQHHPRGANLALAARL